MRRFIEGKAAAVTVLPEGVDDCIDDDNPVRVVDVFVDELELPILCFVGAEHTAAGRPAVPPSGAAHDLHFWLPRPVTAQPPAGDQSLHDIKEAIASYELTAADLGHARGVVSSIDAAEKVDDLFPQRAGRGGAAAEV